MNPRLRLTVQQADPIGGAVAAPLVVVGSAVALAISIAFTFVHLDEIVSPIAALLGIGLVGAAGLALTTGVLRSRAQFASERLWLVVTLATGAAVAEYVSTMGRNAVLYDDYGPVTIGLLLLCTAPYASWIALLGAAGLSSAVLSILVVGSSVSSGSRQPLGSLILIGSAAIIVLATAGAAYSYSMVGSIVSWQRRVNRAALQQDASGRTAADPHASDPHPSEQYASEVVRDPDPGTPAANRLSMLGREVLPFLAAVVSSDRVSVADVDRARELAEALQAALKAGIEATWLDDLAEQLRAERATEVVVDDPSGAAAGFSSDQRTALTAIASWLGDGTRSRLLRISIVEGAGAGRIEVVAEGGAVRPKQRELERIVSIARAVGFGTESIISPERAIVELNYLTT
ncbi:hypothetical protein ACWKWP_14700 [Agromyces soli]